jgi:DNA-binding transcriptional LysR family regulator
MDAGPRSSSGGDVVGAPSLELRHLRYFVAVAEEKHFGRAAERLRIAQPGLSQQIKMLERSLGTPLFVRDQRHVELTPAGETLLKHAYRLLALVDRAVESARLATQGKTGVLKVGTPATGMSPVAHDLLETFRARVPDLEVVLYPELGPHNVEALRKRTVDVAFVNAPFEAADTFEYLRLGSAELLIVLPESHPLAAFDRIPRAALLSEPFIMVPSTVDPTVVEHVHRMLFDEREHPNIVEVPDAMDATRIRLVLQGKGISATSLPADAELQIPGVVFRGVEYPAPFIEHGLAWIGSDATEQVEAVEAFVTFAREFATGVREERDRG